MTDTNRDHPLPQPAGPWRKATASNDVQGCIEMAPAAGGGALVRDSKLGDASPVLHFDALEIACWLDGAKGGEFDDLT